MSHTGFREPHWQRLHIASLTLARQALSAAMAQQESNSDAGVAGRAIQEPDSDGCIDLTSDSRDISGRATEELTQVGLPFVSVHLDDIKLRVGACELCRQQDILVR